jgi:ribosome biogenesis ATPase
LQSTSRIVNQLLTEMDGVGSRAGVYLMAATNRPGMLWELCGIHNLIYKCADMIDPAILRPGRLDKRLYVGFPNAADRKEIIHALTKRGTRPRLASDVDLNTICADKMTDCYTCVSNRTTLFLHLSSHTILQRR